MKMKHDVFCDIVMAVMSDCEPGHPGSSPSRDHYSMVLDRGTAWAGSSIQAFSLSLTLSLSYI